MTKPRLIYFDAPVSRGEECRLALHIAGVDFEDVRIKSADWPALKPNTPFGALPVLELEGRVPIAQSTAILVYVGRRNGLHPKDDFEAARHESIMQHVEDLRVAIAPTLRLKDESEKKSAREALVASVIPTWAASVEKQIGDGPFFGGGSLQVADLKLYMLVRWLSSGKLDHVPASTLAAYPKLNRVHDAVGGDARVRAWHARG